MAEKLKIKVESLPERCEVCHQSDLFDPVSNHCSRCSRLQTTDAKTAFAVRLVNKAPTLTDIEVGIAIGMTMGVLIGATMGLINSYEVNNVLGEVIFTAASLAFF